MFAVNQEGLGMDFKSLYLELERYNALLTAVACSVTGREGEYVHMGTRQGGKLIGFFRDAQSKTPLKLNLMEGDVARFCRQKGGEQFISMADFNEDDYLTVVEDYKLAVRDIVSAIDRRSHRNGYLGKVVFETDGECRVTYHDSNSAYQVEVSLRWDPRGQLKLLMPLDLQVS